MTGRKDREKNTQTHTHTQKDGHFRKFKDRPKYDRMGEGERRKGDAQRVRSYLVDI